jgi:hypothetical protein
MCCLRPGFQAERPPDGRGKDSTFGYSREVGTLPQGPAVSIDTGVEASIFRQGCMIPTRARFAYARQNKAIWISLPST